MFHRTYCKCLKRAAVLAAFALLLSATVGCRPHGEEDVSTITTATTTTTTTTAATTTTTTTKKTTTTTTVATTSLVSEELEGCFLDKNGLLQFKPDGRYVQASSYSDSQAVPWNLVLVNDWNPVPQGYDNHVSLTTVKGGQQVDSRMVDALTAMMQAGRAAAAADMQVVSGYRASSKQDTLYWRQVRQERGSGISEIKAQYNAGQVVKRPGFSEHNCGLAVDLGGNGNFYLNKNFENTAAFKWLIANCADYGFILRFPKGKESITGVIYEPWHYRYVGKEAAREIMSKGWCLEEYLEQTKQ